MTIPAIRATEITRLLTDGLTGHATSGGPDRLCKSRECPSDTSGYLLQRTLALPDRFRPCRIVGPSVAARCVTAGARFTKTQVLPTPEFTLDYRARGLFSSVPKGFPWS